ncbi:MAG: Ldh family oxidoreductase [Rhizobiales bacterium]|nr:Ldh family oxidoreductase [Hyphomicrobiales bacterium]
MSNQSTFPVSSLLSYTSDALRACGLPERDAAITAKAMIEADLTGADAHGIFRLASYVKVLQQKRINPQAKMRVVNRGPATALIDGDNGMGHLVMTHAAETAVEIAREAGVAWVGARRSNHAGAAGFYASIPMAHGMIGIYAACSSANHMAPTGSAEALLGTNPIAVAIPAGEEPPVVLDIATSVIAFGAIRTAAMQGKSVPEGWLIDRTTGKPLTDPKRGHDALMEPIGGYKGAGLALVIGLLAAVLNGAAFGRDVNDFNTDHGGETNTGQFVIALDTARFIDPTTFAAEIDRHLHDFKASARLPGFDVIRLPGMERLRRREERSRNGVTLAGALAKQLNELAGSLGIAPLGARG